MMHKAARAAIATAVEAVLDTAAETYGMETTLEAAIGFVQDGATLASPIQGALYRLGAAQDDEAEGFAVVDAAIMRWVETRQPAETA